MMKNFVLKLLICLLCMSLVGCGGNLANITTTQQNTITDDTTTSNTTRESATSSTPTINDTTTINTPANSAATGSTTICRTTTTTENELSEDEKAAISVFEMDDIARITFYSYYGQGKGSDVSAENMAEITRWLDSFAVGKKAPNPLPPGTNTYHVEIEYVNGTVIKKGLDVIEVAGNYYYLKHDTTPDCFKRIVAKTGL